MEEIQALLEMLLKAERMGEKCSGSSSPLLSTLLPGSPVSSIWSEASWQGISETVFPCNIGQSKEKGGDGCNIKQANDCTPFPADGHPPHFSTSLIYVTNELHIAKYHGKFLDLKFSTAFQPVDHFLLLKVFPSVGFWNTSLGFWFSSYIICYNVLGPFTGPFLSLHLLCWSASGFFLWLLPTFYLLLDLR